MLSNRTINDGRDCKIQQGTLYLYSPSVAGFLDRVSVRDFRGIINQVKVAPWLIAAARERLLLDWSLPFLSTKDTHITGIASLVDNTIINRLANSAALFLNV